MALYLVPIETNGAYRGPMYFDGWRGDPTPGGVVCSWSLMDYGFAPTCLILAKDISQADHDALVLNADVYYFPDDLSEPVSQDVRPFFETINIPTDWMGPSTTNLEFLRQVAGIFQFNQRYQYISAGHSIFESADLDTRLREMTAEEQAWFLATVASFGFDPGLVSDNSQLRLLVKQAGDFWAGQPFYLGGVEF